MSEKNVSSSGGVGVAGLLLVAFVVMKLAGIGAVATWSWVWVLSPIWVSLSVVLTFVAILFTIAGIATVLSKRLR